MATNKFLDADGVKIFWDKCNRTFLSQEAASTDYLGKTENAVSATTATECTGNSATASKLATAKTLTITDGENSGDSTNFDGSENISLKLPATIKAEINGNATTATTLDTPRSIQTNLASTSAANFDGSTDIKIGVTGTLPVANGGTGNSFGNAATATKLLNQRAISIQDYLEVNTGRSTNFDGSSNISIRLPETIQGNLTGNADSATKAEKDFDGNIITETYAPLNSPALTGIPQAPTALPNDDSNQLATTAFVAETIRRLVGAAPQTLDTLVELAVAINKDANFATTIANELSQKQPKNDALTSISNLLTSSDKMIYTKSSNVYETTNLTAFARSLLDDATALMARNTLDALGKTENAVSATTAKECTGNSATAAKLQTARKINVQDFYSANSGDLINFDGSENISLKLPATIKAEINGNSATASKFATAKTLTITDGENSGDSTNFDGSENIFLKLPATIKAEINGNSATASKLATAKTLTITDGENNGDSTNFDGSENISLKLPATIKAEINGNSATASKLATAKTLTITDGENSGDSTNFDGSENISLKLPATIKAEITGNATTATRADSAAQSDKLETPRNIQTNLASTSAENFDGSTDIKIGVTGILPVENGGTGSNNLEEITVGAAIQAEKDSAGNVIVEKYLPKFEKILLTIPNDGWQLNSEHENFNYICSLEIEGVTPDDILNINLAPQSHGVAVTCGLCSTFEITNGLIWMLAKTAPTAEISAEYYILKGQNSGKEISYGAINTSTSQREIIYVTPEQDGKLFYSGGILRPIWKNYDPTKLLISGETSGIDAKSYAVTFTPIGNCTWSDDTRTPRRVIWKIDKAIIQLPLQIGKLIYSGEIQSPNLKNYDPAKMTLSGDFENKIDAGIYTAYATPNENFTFEDSNGAKSFTWQIDKLELEKPTATDTEKIYNGEIQSPTILNFDSNYIEQTGIDAAINAGEFSAIYELKDKNNTQWQDGAQNAVILVWKIDKAELEFSLDKNSLYLENAKITDSIFVNRKGDGVISANSADSSVATVSVDGENILVTAVSSGSTEIIIEIAEGTNYLSGGAVVDVETFVIKPLNLCTPAEILDAVKSEKAVNAWRAGDKTAPISLTGNIGAALTLNNFEICARILGFNHNSQLESGGKSSVHFALDVSVEGVNIALCDSNFDSASASGVEYFQHNLKNGSNAGGWLESNIRTKILAVIFDALPQDWQEIISPCTKYTNNIGGGFDVESQVSATQDKLFLLSEFEIFGRQDYSNDIEPNFQQQYEYFQNGNEKIHYKQNEISTPCYWWLRTPQFNNDTSFCRVDVSGVENTYNALYSQGIVPCFAVF